MITLQLSGVENAFLAEDGTLQIYGQKIADTEAETEPEIVGIQYPPEFVCHLMNFLNEHFDIFFADNITIDNSDTEDMENWNPEDDGDPFAPGFDSDE